MAVMVANYSTNVNAVGWEPTEYIDTSISQRETTYNGQTYHWAPNQERSFMDDGVGRGHQAFGAVGVVFDNIPFNNNGLS